MPEVEVVGLCQKAVLWTQTGVRGDGSPSLADPVQISARYEKTVQEQPSSTQQAKSKPTTVYVDREIAVGSQMWLGKLVDLPSPLTKVYVVLSYREVPDLKGRNIQRTVTLGRR